MAYTIETERLWHEFHERLLAYIRPRVAGADDAEDILQDVFVRIHSKMDQLRETDAFTGWVYQITRNAITDYHRRRATAARALEGLADCASDPAADAPDITRQAETDFVRCLDPMLDQLPDQHREAIVLTELNGMTQAQAAGELGLSVSGMKSRVQRGRAQLKDAILDCCAVEFDRRGGVVDYRRREGSSCGGGCDCGEGEA